MPTKNYLWAELDPYNLPDVPSDVNRLAKDIDTSLKAEAVRLDGNIKAEGTRLDGKIKTEAERITAGVDRTAVAERRISALETLGGLAPGDVSDATAAGLISNPDSLTAAALAPVVSASAAKDVETPASPVRKALEALFAPRKYPKDWAGISAGVAQHRGGGASMPQNTMEALRANLSTGAAFLDIDMRITADLVPVLAHSNYMQDETNMSGVWTEFPSANLGAVRWQGGRMVGGRWPDLAAVTIAQVLDEFGGKVPMIIEPKNVGVGAEWNRSLDALAPLLKERGLEGSVYVAIYGSLIDTHLAAIRSRGLKVYVYQDSALPGHNDTSLIAKYKTDKVDLVGLSSVVSNATASAWVASGIPTFVSPGNRRWRWAELKAAGVKHCIDDYALYVDGLNDTIKVDLYRNGLWGLGDVPAIGHTKPTLLTDGLLFDNYKNAYQCMLIGDFAPLPASYELHFEVAASGLDSGAPWFGFNVCSQDDKSWTNTEADPTGYNCFIAPRTGNLAIWQRSGGASFKRAETLAVGSPVNPSGSFHGKIVVTPASVKIARTNGFKGAEYGSATYNNSANRGGYVHVAAFASSTAAPKFTLKKAEIVSL